jgi:hypothetical protein
VNVSTSATTKIEKLFTKHPRKEEHNINEKYVKHLQHEIESKHREIEYENRVVSHTLGLHPYVTF